MQSNWSGATKFTTVGLEFVLSVGVGTWGGHALDTKLGSLPWLTLLGAACGIAAGYRAIARALREANRLAELEEERERRTREAYYNRDRR